LTDYTNSRMRAGFFVETSLFYSTKENVMGWIIAILIIVVLGVGGTKIEDMDNPFVARTVGFIALVILILIFIGSC
jgi:hypothetical protein